MSGKRRFWLTLLPVLLLGGLRCTTPASWQGEGTAGEACFPDNTCDPGLHCVAGRCQLPLISSDAAATDDAVSDAPHPGEDSAAPCIGQLPPPQLKPLPELTLHPSYPILGHAPGAREVRISGGAQLSTARVQDEYFCAEVPLVANALNSLEVVAVDQDGCLSASAQASLLQEQPTRINQLLGLPAWSSDAPKAGALTQLTDGMTNASVKFWFYDLTPLCDEHIALAFDLKEQRTLEQLVVRYPDTAEFNHFLSCWALLASDEEEPLPPGRKTPGWRVLAESDKEKAGPLTIPLAGASARQLALLLYQDGAHGIWESFDLTEIEAWGSPELGAPPRCP